MEQPIDHFHRHIGVYGICISNEQLLVIRKTLGPYTGKFDLPGGRMEPFESLEIAIKREFQEETGYELLRLAPIGVCDFFVTWTLRNKEDELVHHIAILYETNVDSNMPIASIASFEGQDSCEAVWMPLNDLTAIQSSPLVLQAIEWHRSRNLPDKTKSFDFRTP
ncbi:NUDIX hydrolase [Paenibacillus curdlanolyticus YK9]|uniref:NUDIX hydrolase n=1 Tax=Paenibacillus curdlanolyticus YK9 TaxID=717606 RepID=E0ICT4_9BACL|nr:NUDIX hydrolase [Paenibacillus curdlanolyticus YK9]